MLVKKRLEKGKKLGEMLSSSLKEVRQGKIYFSYGRRKEGL